MAAPLLVQMEADIDREMEQDRLAEQRRADGEDDFWDEDVHGESSSPEPPLLFYGPQQQIITNDLKSLDEMVSTNKILLKCQSSTIYFKCQPSTLYFTRSSFKSFFNNMFL